MDEEQELVVHVVHMVGAWLVIYNHWRRLHRRVGRGNVISMTPRHNYDSKQWIILRRFYMENDNTCHAQLRMRRAPFHRLCRRLRGLGLEDSRHVMIEEQVAMFLFTVGHDQRNRSAVMQFIRSGETVSLYFHRVLNVLIRLNRRVIVNANQNNSPQDCRRQQEWHHHFENAVGAVDGTHFESMVPVELQPRYQNRKSVVSQNVLMACSFDMRFTYVLAGWEGSAHDGRVLRAAVSRTGHRLTIPEECQDTGIPLLLGFKYQICLGIHSSTWNHHLHNLLLVLQKKEQCRWSQQMDEILVASLIIDLEKRGRRAEKGFLSATLKAVAVAVSEGCNTIVSSENVRSRVKTLKKDYIAMKAALEASGFGISWDEGAKYITAEPGAWDDYVKSHPDARGLRHKFFPHYDSLAIICGVDNATGDGMVSGHDPEALGGTRGGTPLEDDEGENGIEDLGSEPSTGGVAMDEDSPATVVHPPSDSGRSKGKTPPPLPRCRKRIDDSQEVLSMSAISSSIASIADTIRKPNLGGMVTEMENIPGMSRMMLLKNTALLADKPALVYMYQAMKEDLKLEWLEMMLDKNGY